MIDAYSLKARVYPMIILLSPILVSGLFLSIQFESIMHGVSSIGLVGMLSYLFSQLGRDQGKKKEPELWNSWGGAPTSQLLRFTDAGIDKYTKERYHAKLKQLCPTSDLPNPEPEKINPTCSDEIYAAWTRYLISKTRDHKVFPLLLKENISYGFRRNLWALKPFAILLLIILILLIYLAAFTEFSTLNPIEFSISYWYFNTGLFLILLFWIRIVNREWVKVPAFAYAFRLCEAIDQL
jgi:hypothetical protein